MNRSENISTLAGAIVAAQAKIEGAVKDKTNPHYKSKYADLSSVMIACKDALSENGIAVLQSPLPSEPGMLSLETILMHKSGEFVGGTMTMTLGKNDPQGYGSALTYARRYSLAAMVGVCPEDDDAEGAQGRGRPVVKPQTTQQQAKPTETVSDFAAYGDLMDDNIFIEQFTAACDARKLDDVQTHAIQTLVCKKKKVAQITMLPVADKFNLIKAVKDGKFDPKQPETQQRKAS